MDYDAQIQQNWQSTCVQHRYCLDTGTNVSDTQPAKNNNLWVWPGHGCDTVWVRPRHRRKKKRYFELKKRAHGGARTRLGRARTGLCGGGEK